MCMCLYSHAFMDHPYTLGAAVCLIHFIVIPGHAEYEPGELTV